MRMNGLLSPKALCRTFIFSLLLLNVGCCCCSPGGWIANRSGMRQYARGHYTQARHRFARAVARDPWNPDYRHNLAMAIQKQGDPAASEQILRYNLSLDAMHQPTYHSLAQLMISQGRAPEAQDMIASWAATQPYVPEANVEMAWIQRETGDVAGAEQSLLTALQADPTHPIALAHMGQLYQGSGRSDQAVAYYQRSLAAKWDQPEVQSRLASLSEPGSLSRSAMMQNPSQSMMMAGAPTMIGDPMMASAPIMTGDPTIASAPTVTNEASMVAMVPAPSSVPAYNDPLATSFEEVKPIQEPHRKGRRRGRMNEPTVASYPLPDFGSSTGWVPSGTIGGQPAMAYQTTAFPVDASMMSQAGPPQIAPPQISDSIASPYVTNSFGPTQISQADPAHSSDSGTEMTAAAPTVDAH